ncbi:NTE family protein [Alteromonadaceae bacterium Bs31]|nr:NTE family protein [Alteromonadaceae bacterium Bs31]
MSTNALILSGGGARASYQVGVVTALSEIIPQLRNPFPIICGTSAGAINAAAIAAHPGVFRQSAQDLASIWQKLEIENVFRSGWLPLLGGGSKILASLFNEGIGRTKPLALLDNSPLRDFLLDLIPFDNLAKKISSGDLEALCITALGYNSGESVSFFQGNPALRGWRRFRRVGTPSEIGVDHLMASSAIPAVFPTVPLNREYFGDGAMRQMAPISSALHLGADRVFIIGVSGNRNPAHWGEPKYKPRPKHSPSMAQIVGHMFNSAFIDALEGDIEQLQLVNKLLYLLDEQRCDKTAHLRPVDTLIISPSKALDKIAGRHVRNMPPSLRFFLRAIGATAHGGGSAAASYLLFTNSYCDELMELGYQDAMWERNTIEEFFLKNQNS